MSCLTPIHIYNKATFLNESASSAFLCAPCGHCPTCVDTKTLEYKLRAFYEWQDTLSKGGFAYMETFTYNQQSYNERKFHGIPCFRSEDITQLMKKLRNRCKGLCTFRYFLSSEYGGLYKRPHYHCIFYVIPCKIDKFYNAERLLLQFYRFVKESWTEQVIDKTTGQPLYHINKYGRMFPVMRSLGFIDRRSTLGSRMITRVDGMNYVAKYVVKDDNFVKEVNQRFDELIENCVHDSETYNNLLEEKRKSMPFHRQSQGFGASLLPELLAHLDEIKQNPVKFNLRISNGAIPLPLYYLRKLFYKPMLTGIYSPSTGKPCYSWRPTRLGEEFELIQKQKQIERYEEKYNDALSNFFIYMEDAEVKYKEVFKLLNGRTLHDFIIYKLIYKGHLHNNFAFATDTSKWKEFFVLSRRVGTVENYAYDDDKNVKKEFRKFLSESAINDTINPIWKDFDQIDYIFDEFFKNKSDSIIGYRDYISDVKSKLKLLQTL